MNAVIFGREKGMVLLLVLVVVALLTALLSEFAFSSLVDLRLAETYRDSTRAYYLARGGVRAAQMFLREDSNSYDARTEMWGGGVANLPIGGGILTVSIEDLDGKLAINSLVSGNNPQTVQKDRFLRLFTNLGLETPQDLVASLIDWLDTDNEVYIQDGALGAESNYYLGMDPRYQARNSSMASIEELSLVKGYTPEVIDRIKDYVTLIGSMQVNCNTAPAEVVATLYFDAEQPVFLKDAEAVVAARNDTPFTGVEAFQAALPQLSSLFPTSDQLNYSLKYTSDYYLVRSQAWINDGTRTVTAVVRKSSNGISNLRVD